MNICIIVSYFSTFVRGNEYGLAQSLALLGNNVTIITSTAGAPREKMLLDAKIDKTLKYNFNVEYLTSLMDLGDNPLTIGMKNQIKDQDLVMLVEDYPLISHKAYKAAKKYNIPIILSSERTYYPENRIKKYALKVLDITTNKKLRNGVDVLTAHCTAAREFMAEELGVKREIKVIHVGVDTQLFKPLQSEGKYLTKGGYKILTVARLHYYKGLNYLIKAMETIKGKVPDAHLYIIGKGPEEQNLKNLTEKLHLNNSVTFITTPVQNYIMPEIYAECDIYVQPSIIEPYGIAVLEAMSCEKPVVGTLVGGMKDTISNEETGFLVDAMDIDQLAGRIIALNDQKLRKKLGQNARQRVLSKFDWSIIASNYMEIINAIREK